MRDRAGVSQRHSRLGKLGTGQVSADRLQERVLSSEPGAGGSQLRTWQRYWLFQIPGLAIVSALLAAGAHWFSLPLWACVLGLAFWLVKDAALYPFLKSAYEGSKPTGPESLIGALGTAREDLHPGGLVRVGPELWRAESTVPVRAGQVVQVSGCEGMMLRVIPSPPEADRDGEIPPVRDETVRGRARFGSVLPDPHDSQRARDAGR